MNAVTKETITIFQYKSVYILYRFYACCTGIPNVSLLQNGCCNMATINIMHFTTLQLKSHAAQYFTSSAINSSTTSHLATLMWHNPHAWDIAILLGCKENGCCPTERLAEVLEVSWVVQQGVHHVKGAAVGGKEFAPVGGPSLCFCSGPLSFLLFSALEHLSLTWRGGTCSVGKKNSRTCANKHTQGTCTQPCLLSHVW